MNIMWIFVNINIYYLFIIIWKIKRQSWRFPPFQNHTPNCKLNKSNRIWVNIEQKANFKLYEEILQVIN